MSRETSSIPLVCASFTLGTTSPASEATAMPMLT